MTTIFFFINIPYPHCARYSSYVSFYMSFGVPTIRDEGLALVSSGSGLPALGEAQIKSGSGLRPLKKSGFRGQSKVRSSRRAPNEDWSFSRRIFGALVSLFLELNSFIVKRENPEGSVHACFTKHETSTDYLLKPGVWCNNEEIRSFSVDSAGFQP